MKIQLPVFLLLILTSQVLIGQIIAGESDVTEYDYFYSDTANGEFAYGNYEPKDIMKFDDGSILIGTELSIYFPSEYITPEKFDSTYFAKSKIFQQKSHTSSGTIFMLNSNFEKVWETVFKEQRIEKILKTSDDRILIVGEDVSMKFVWLAELDKDGNVEWEKHYDYKNQVTIADALIDDNDEIYLLLEASQIIPIQRNYSGKKRIRLFKDSEINTHLSLLKVSSLGNKKWNKVIDKRKKYGKYGYKLVSNQEVVFCSFIYSGFEQDSLIQGEKVVEFSKSGKRVDSQDISKQNILFFKNGLLSITSYSKGKLFLYHSGNLIDSIDINSADSDVRIENVINQSSGFLILGSNHDNNRDYLLIKLSPDLKFQEYWTYPKDEYNEIRGAVELYNGDTVIIGKCYKRGKDRNLTTYINLVKIRKGA